MQSPNYHRNLIRYSTGQLLMHLYKRYEVDILYGLVGLTLVCTAMHAIGVF